MGRHASEESLENVIEFLILEILCVCSSVLRARTILFRSELVIVFPFFRVDEVGVGVGDFFEDLFGS